MTVWYGEPRLLQKQKATKKHTLTIRTQNLSHYEISEIIGFGTGTSKMADKCHALYTGTNMVASPMLR